MRKLAYERVKQTPQTKPNWEYEEERSRSKLTRYGHRSPVGEYDWQRRRFQLAYSRQE
jgi:hypothetical protein